MARRTSSRLVTSPTTGSAFFPKRSATSRSAASRRATSTTDPPRETIELAAAAPIPPLPPVMTTTVPCLDTPCVTENRLAGPLAIRMPTRLATLDDVPELVRVINCAYAVEAHVFVDARTNDADVRDRLARPNACFLVIDHGPKPGRLARA